MNTLLTGTAIAVLLATSTAAMARDDHRERGHGRWKNDHGEHRDHDRGRHRGHSETVWVEVVHAEPIYEYIRISEPRRYCSERGPTVYRDGRNSGAGMLIGGVIGGAIGHDIARDGHGDAAIVAGTLLGALIGHDLDHNRTVVSSGGYTTCETRYDDREEAHIVGYRVKYRYYDRYYYTRTDRHPGPRVRVTINLM